MYPNPNNSNFYGNPSYINHPMVPNQMNSYTMNSMVTFPRNRMYQKPLTKAFANFNYYNFLEGTQKTLTTVNQIIPIVNQVSPMIRNATMLFKVANVINTMPNTPMQTTTPPTSAPLVKQNIVEKPTLF